MRRRPELSTLDRFGIAAVSLFGVCIGLLIGSASDVRITPTLVMIFPGILIGVAVVRFWGVTAAVIACGIANGLAYGFALYGWYRLAGALRNALPQWLGSVGVRLSRVLSRRLK